MRHHARSRLLALTALSAVIATGAAAQTGDAPAGPGPATVPPAAAPAPQPTTEAPAPARAMDADMRAVLTKLEQLGAQPLGSQGVAATRAGPTPADAVKAILRERGENPDEMLARMGVAKREVRYPTAGTTMPIQLYTPSDAGPGPHPVVIYFHGGGWVIADTDTYEASAAALAQKTKAIVASVEYRRAPESQFPAAHEDAVAAYRWIIENAGPFNGDSDRVAVAGESAGGNLAINTAIAARDQRLNQPEHMLLIYPVAGTDINTPSFQANADAAPLSRAAMEWFVSNAVRSPADLQDPRLDVVGHARLAGLPPATIVTAEIDPLTSGGEQLAQKLRDAGVQTEHRHFEGVTHEFFGMAPVVAKAEEAQRFAAGRLIEALGSGVAQGSTR